MEYKIVEKQGFKVFGKSIVTTQVDRKYTKDCKPFLNYCHESGLHEKIRITAGYGPRKEPGAKQVFQVLHDFKANGDFKYMITAEYPAGIALQDDFEILYIPAATWAVFSDRCPLNDAIGKKVGEIWKRVPEWLEATGYEFAEQPSLEVPSYTDKEKIGEVWLPVVKKQS